MVLTLHVTAWAGDSAEGGATEGKLHLVKVFGVGKKKKKKT